MIVSELTITNLRVLQQAMLSPVPGLNLIIGNNGSGKTSVLEALYLLGHGRSFRHRDAAPMIRDGELQTTVVARLLDDKQSSHTLGLARTSKEFIARFDGANIKKRSELITHLPLIWIGPSPQDLITGSPEHRRRFIDQGLFHVEQSYLGVSQRYGRLLSQRNEALRKGMFDTVMVWDAPISEAGEMLSDLRKRLVDKLTARVKSLLVHWELGLDIELKYVSGWKDGQSLKDALQETRARDFKQRFTGSGPHRADLSIKLRAGTAGKRLSRGQLKMSSVGLHFGLADILKHDKALSPLLLIDDLSAELDNRNRQRLLVSSDTRFSQVFATALEAKDVPVPAKQVFHVEQGSLIGAGLET